MKSIMGFIYPLVYGSSVCAIGIVGSHVQDLEENFNNMKSKRILRRGIILRKCLKITMSYVVLLICAITAIWSLGSLC